MRSISSCIQIDCIYSDHVSECIRDSSLERATKLKEDLSCVAVPEDAMSKSTHIFTRQVYPGVNDHHGSSGFRFRGNAMLLASCGYQKILVG